MTTSTTTAGGGPHPTPSRSGRNNTNKHDNNHHYQQLAHQDPYQPHPQQQQQHSPVSSRPTSPPLYFGIPIVGFFRPPQSYSTTNDNEHHHTLPLHESSSIMMKRNRRPRSQSMRDVSSSSSFTTTRRSGSMSNKGSPPDANDHSNHNHSHNHNYGSFSPYNKRHHSERPSPSYYSNIYQQSLRLQQSQPSAPTICDISSTGSSSSTTTTTTSPTRRRRTALELWDIVRFHVHHETFHIDSAYWHHIVHPTDGNTLTKHPTSSPRDSLLLFTHSPYETHDSFHEMMDLPYDFTIRDCILALGVYLGISIVAYSFVFERWSIIDSMYFACVSFTTIGYGDLSPSTTGGRFFCIFFALGGVAILAIALGVLGSNIIENEVKAMESTKHKIVDEILSRWPKKNKDNPKILLHSSSANGGGGDNGENGQQQHHHSSSFDYLRDFDDPTIHDDYDDYNSISKMKQIQEFCTLFTQMLCRYVPSLLPLFIGSLIIGHNEGWSFIDSIYYCVVTTTTIGYGDRVPQHEGMKLFAVLFIPLSVGAMGHFLGTVANFIIEQRRKAYDKQLWKHELTMQDLYCMSDTGVVTELDFVIFMLQAMKKVDRELIDHIRHHFRVLDVTHSNTLCRDDLELMAKKKLRSVKTKLRMSAYRQSIIQSNVSSSSVSKSNGTPPSVSACVTPQLSFD